MPWIGWSEFILAFATFLALHAIPVRPPVKPWLVARIGQRGFTIAYSGMSLLALVWLIGATARAPYVELWSSAVWQAWVPLILMLPVTIIVGLTLGRPNPFSFGGGDGAEFDLNRPGIVRLHRHPMLVALAIWSGAHVVPNGDLAHVILFGTFLGFSILGMRMIDRRRQRTMGSAWQKTLTRLRKQSVATALQPPLSTMLRVLAGIALYVAVLHAHYVIFGVGPL